MIQAGDAAGSRDNLAQTLSLLLLQVNALQAQVSPDATAATLDIAALRSGLADLEQQMRLLLQELRASDEDDLPPELSGRSLAEALTQMVEEAAEALGLSSRVALSGEERPLAPASERLFYYVAREALYQLQSHEGAHRLRLALAYGRDDVQMSIEDDGRAPDSGEEAPAPPFTQPPVSRNTIMRDLRRRIEALGGALEVSAEPGQGTRVLARLPYVEPESSSEEIPAVPGAVDSAGAAERVRVLIVESQAVTRAGLRRLLEGYPDLLIVGEAADGVQGVSETLELGPQLVLLDMQLPNGQSLEALGQIKQLNLDTRVLVLSAQDREEFVYEALRAGADGYVLKDIAADELAQAVRTVARGNVLVQPAVAGQLLSRLGRQARPGYPSETLTARELEVLHLLARGLRNKEIAARLHVSERTVNFHLANIYQKLNVSGRTEALSKALAQGLVSA